MKTQSEMHYSKARPPRRAVFTALFTGVAIALGVGNLSAQGTVHSLSPVGLFNGGGVSAGGPYTFHHTIGQPTLGSASGGPFSVAIGFVHQSALLGGTGLATTLWGGLSHAALSNATVSVSSNGLQISNLGSSGQDGVSIVLGRADGWGADLIHQLGASNRTDGSRIEWTVLGVKDSVANQSVICGRLERGPDGVAMYADGSLVGATMFELEVRSNGVVLAHTTVNSGRIATLRPTPGTPVGPWGVIRVVWQGLTGPNDGWCSLVCYRDYVLTEGQPISQACDVGFDDPADPGGDIFISGADTVRIRPASMTANVGKFSTVQLRGLNSGDFTLGEEAVALLGHWHRGVGGALLDTAATNGPTTLRVRNLGSSGADGFEVFAGGSDLWTDGEGWVSLPGRIVQAWPDDWVMPWLTSSNGHVRWTATGRVQGSNNSFESLSDLTMFNGEQGTMLSASFAQALGVTQVEVEVFNGPALVGSVTLPVGNLGTFSNAAVRRVAGQISDNSLVMLVTGAEPWNFQPGNGSSALVGDRFRITAFNPTVVVEFLRSLITRGASVESFALSGFNSAAPQRPRLSAPRFIPGGGITLPIATEADVAYRIETSSSINGPWTPIGQVMGTDRVSETDFEDTTLFISNRVRLFRVRIR